MVTMYIHPDSHLGTLGSLRPIEPRVRWKTWATLPLPSGLHQTPFYPGGQGGFLGVGGPPKELVLYYSKKFSHTEWLKN